MLDWFHQLEGTWVLKRRIVESSERPGGARMTGIVTFERRDHNVLCYQEEGVLKMANGATVNAARRYLYRFERGVLSIDFADGPDRGRPFLRLDLDADHMIHRHTLREWRLADHHLCGKDLYQAEYRFREQQKEGRCGTSRGIERISQRTVVSGPRKDYAIVSILRRPAGASRSS